MSVTWQWEGVQFAAAGISAFVGTVRQRVNAAVMETAYSLHTEVMFHTDGRPGPNRITGEYRGSWFVDELEGSGKPAARVGTGAAQGARLERGFYGADSLGRVYNQPPFPHLGPAVEAVAPRFRDLIQKAIT